MKELLKKLRKYEIQIRKVLNTQMQGDFHSVFKGSGIEYDDVRTYQYGDDIRSIDWNVSAKGHGTYVKTFKEEKEQVVFFVLDVSASQEIGRSGFRKIDIAKEICGVLALSALKENSQVGLLCFSDGKEKYIKPGKGMKHGYELISAIYKLKPASLKTNLSEAVRYTLGILKKRGIVIFISDFIDENYSDSFQLMCNKHDVVAIQLAEQREMRFPLLGIIPVFDKESKRTVWMNTSSISFRRKINGQFIENKRQLEDICRRNKASYQQVLTHEDFVPKLVQLFRHRRKAAKI
jgi:uncharacterized protein (DUF58 family)